MGRRHLETLGRLKRYLEAEGVRLSSTLDDAELRATLRYGWPYRLWSFVRDSCVDGDAVSLVRAYDTGCAIDLHLGYIGAPGWVSVGWKMNPGYQDEMKAYDAETNEIKKTNRELEAMRQALKQSELGVAHRRVVAELAMAECSICYGGGVIPSMAGLADSYCSSCGGTGKTGYEPQLPDTSREQAAEYEKQLQALQERPHKCPEPQREKPVYMRAKCGST